jgi:hypothetical protein
MTSTWRTDGLLGISDGERVVPAQTNLTSWWAQPDRESFMKAHRQQLPRIVMAPSSHITARDSNGKARTCDDA